jgi:chemotaxis protein histidine kinase CheA
VFLERLLMGTAATENTIHRHNFIAVLDADGRHFGLLVEGLADPEEIVVKPLSPVLKGIGLYSGATVLGNAELALILDPSAIALRLVSPSAAKTKHCEPKNRKATGAIKSERNCARMRYSKRSSPRP